MLVDLPELKENDELSDNDEEIQRSLCTKNTVLFEQNAEILDKDSHRWDKCSVQIVFESSEARILMKSDENIFVNERFNSSVNFKATTKTTMEWIMNGDAAQSGGDTIVRTFRFKQARICDRFCKIIQDVKGKLAPLRKESSKHNTLDKCCFQILAWYISITLMISVDSTDFSDGFSGEHTPSKTEFVPTTNEKMKCKTCNKQNQCCECQPQGGSKSQISPAQTWTCPKCFEENRPIDSKCLFCDVESSGDLVPVIEKRTGMKQNICGNIII